MSSTGRQEVREYKCGRIFVVINHLSSLSMVARKCKTWRKRRKHKGKRKYAMTNEKAWQVFLHFTFKVPGAGPVSLLFYCLILKARKVKMSEASSTIFNVQLSRNEQELRQNVFTSITSVHPITASLGVYFHSDQSHCEWTCPIRNKSQFLLFL